MNPYVRNIGKNDLGRDFVVGDIHGCYDQFMRLLDEVHFDKNKDRVISTGDLIDRGNDSLKCANLIVEPWFYAVRGNHEQMFIDWVGGSLTDEQYFYNGGGWVADVESDALKSIAELFEKLPIAIELLRDDLVIGVVHADVSNTYWDTFKNSLLLHDNIRDAAMWSRNRISKHYDHPIKGVECVFLGHTPVDSVQTIGNCIYLDTGCVFGKSLTMIEVGDLSVHSVPYFKGG